MKRFIPFVKRNPLVSVVRLSGVIGAGPRAALSDEGLERVLTRAFTKGKPNAVALIINSPGGSPVQSALIGMRIRRLAETHKLPVHAFVEDVAASGGYWLACAADQIFADRASIVGSIGVISAGFGAHELLARQGVERRVYTAGHSKSMLDPFRPENPDDVARLKTILGQMHGVFIDWVQQRRGQKLQAAGDTPLFEGDIWMGEGAQALGLIDGIGHMEDKMKETYGRKTRFAWHSRRRPMFQRFGMQLAQDALGGIEERAAFARFGL